MRILQVFLSLKLPSQYEWDDYILSL